MGHGCNAISLENVANSSKKANGAKTWDTVGRTTIYELGGNKVYIRGIVLKFELHTYPR